MPAEIFASLSAFKTMLDMAKALKDMNDAAVRNGAVIELQEKILTAREAQSALLDRVRELEEEVRGFEAWEATKQRYDLKNLGWGALAYMLKPAMRGAEPPHWICTNCYSDGRIKIIQHTMVKGSGYRHVCPQCHLQINYSPEAIAHGAPKWLD